MEQLGKYYDEIGNLRYEDIYINSSRMKGVLNGKKWSYDSIFRMEFTS